MLAFITTLRHPQNSVDYGRVEKLLKETLHSVADQRSEQFIIIVVGNKLPPFVLPKNTYFVKVGFPAPAPPTGATTAREPFVWDKGTKLGVGLVAAREFNPTHVMFFDADDFVHRNLAGTVSDQPEHNGWVVREGWIYSGYRNCYARQRDFNRTCGTSFIVPFSAFSVPIDLKVTSTQEQIAGAFGERLSSIMGAHRNAEQWYEEHGRKLEVLPYPAAVYHVDTGENHSGKSLSGLARPLSRKLRRDFGIRPSRGSMSTIWQAIGFRALRWEIATKFRATLRRLHNLAKHPS